MQQHKTILIADGGEADRAILRRILAAQYDTLEAGDGAAALRVLQENAAVDAVVLDLRMPVMDGYAFLRAARGIARLATLPMLAITPMNDLEAELRALGCGATDFVAKPVHPDILGRRLENLLRLDKAEPLHSPVQQDEATDLSDKNRISDEPQRINDSRKALKNEEFAAFLQPKYNMEIGGILDAEAYHVIFNSIDQPIGLFRFSNDRLTALRLNDAYYRLAGLSRAEMMANSGDVFGVLCEKDRQWLKPALKQLQPGQLLAGNVCQRLPDGRSLKMEIQLRLLSPGEDKDNRVVWMTACQRSHDRDVSVQELFDSIPAGLGIYDLRDNQLLVRYLSPGMAKLNELPEEPYYHETGSDLALLLGEKQTEQLRQNCMAAYEKNQLMDQRYLYTTSKGNRRWAWMQGRVVKRSGGLTCYALISDVTEQEQMARQLQQAYREIRMDQERYATALLLSGSEM